MISPLTAAAVVLLAAAAASDLRSRRIPNQLTVTGLLLALALRGLSDGSPAVLEGLGGAGIAFLVVLPLFAMRGIGGGDAKLMIMVGAFLGVYLVLPALLATALAGGAMSLIAAARAGVMLPALANAGGLLRWVFSFGRRGERTTLATAGAVSVPYGVAIAIGSVIALFIGGGS